MAIHNTPLPDDINGHVERIVVIKHRLGKTILTAFPDMSKIVYNEKQKAEQKKFSEAVAYARAIISDPQKKAMYQAILPKGKKVYHAAIAEYMQKNISDKENRSESVLVQLSYVQNPLLLDMIRRRRDSGSNMKNNNDQ
jgi:hypothetical protein